VATLEEFPWDAPAAGAGSCLIFSPVKYVLPQFLLWNSRHSFSACASGSCPRFAHQAFSSPTSWSVRWWVAQSGTVHSSLTFRPIARGCA
jgi:hypothetical protein